MSGPYMNSPKKQILQTLLQGKVPEKFKKNNPDHLFLTKPDLETGNLIEKLHENSMLCLSRLILYQHILNYNKFILYPKQITDTTYSRLVSFYYAASHCTKVKGSGTLSLDTKDLLEETTRKLIGGKETNSIGTGAES